MGMRYEKNFQWKRKWKISGNSFFNPISPGVLSRDRFLGGGLKDPQPSTGPTHVRFLWKSHHLIRSLSWLTVQKGEWISSKMRKIWGFEFLQKSLKLRKSFKFIKEKSGGTISKVSPFFAQCSNFFNSCTRLLLKKVCNSKRKKLWVFKTPPPQDS